MTGECKECSNNRDEMMLVAVFDFLLFFLRMLVICWPCKKPFHFIFYILLLLLKRPECLMESNNIFC